jgi:hypothetical protein
VNLADDGSGESDETLVVTITGASGAARGSRITQTTTIVEGNRAPQATLTLTQMGQPRSQVFGNQGLVSVNATAVDPNGDAVVFDFSGSDAELIPDVVVGAGFAFDPAGVTPGAYRVRVTARDAAGGAVTVEAPVLVAASAPPLGAGDSDGDGIADSIEGFGDADQDGAPDYLDRFAESFVIADQGGQPGSARVLEAESGLSLRLGATAIASGRSGALVSFEDLGGDAANDAAFEHVGGVFDFELSGLVPGASASIVIPLQTGLRPGAVWRKYAADTGWRDFVIDGANRVASAAAVGGVCPAPASSAYVAGLNALHRCVRLTLQDGGPNDDDAQANGRILDPSGAAVMATSETPSTPSGKSGGGGSIAPSLLLGMGALALANLYRRRRRAA